MYYVVFCITATVLLAAQTLADYAKGKRLGECKIRIENGPTENDYCLYLFRALLCIVASGYLVWRTGDDFRFHVLVFVAVMAGLFSKIFYPILASCKNSSKRGIYENGVNTFGGIRLYKEINNYSIGINQNSQKSYLIFYSKFPIILRDVLITFEQSETKKITAQLNKKCKRHSEV